MRLRRPLPVGLYSLHLLVLLFLLLTTLGQVDSSLFPAELGPDRLGPASHGVSDTVKTAATEAEGFWNRINSQAKRLIGKLRNPRDPPKTLLGRNKELGERRNKVAAMLSGLPEERSKEAEAFDAAEQGMVGTIKSVLNHRDKTDLRQEANMKAFHVGPRVDEDRQKWEMLRTHGVSLFESHKRAFDALGIVRQAFKDLAEFDRRLQDGFSQQDLEQAAKAQERIENDLVTLTETEMALRAELRDLEQFKEDVHGAPQLDSLIELRKDAVHKLHKLVEFIDEDRTVQTQLLGMLRVRSELRRKSLWLRLKDMLRNKHDRLTVAERHLPPVPWEKPLAPTAMDGANLDGVTLHGAVQDRFAPSRTAWHDADMDTATKHPAYIDDNASDGSISPLALD